VKKDKKNMAGKPAAYLGGKLLTGAALSVCTCAFLFTELPPRLSSAKPIPQAQDKIRGPASFNFDFDAAESDVVEVVQSVAEDSVVRGTYVYENDKILTGATPAETSTYFGRWTGPGHVFYKVFKGAIAPRHFNTSGDIGTITVRYVVEPRGDSRTHLQIDAVFVENGRYKGDTSDGTVESSEFKEIQDRLRQVQITDQETAALIRKRQDEDNRRAASLRQSQEATARLETAETDLKSLDLRLRELQHDVEVRVKSDSTELKSAPFHAATKLQDLSAGAQVVVLIVTPAWYGVETLDGRRGWLKRDQVEALP
jgi:hypothetical protein